MSKMNLKCFRFFIHITNIFIDMLHKCIKIDLFRYQILIDIKSFPSIRNVRISICQ